MKQRISIIAILTFIAVLIFLLFSRGPTRLSDDRTSMTQAIATSNSTLIIRKLTSSKTNATKTQPSFSAALKTPDASAPSQFNERIEFYGKVIDEGNNAVPNAQVQFEWDHMNAPFQRTNKRTITNTDLQGMFSLNDASGQSLDVRVSKKGYYTPAPAVQTFAYSGVNRYFPDIANPVIFKLKKRGQGAQLIESDIPQFPKRLKLRNDGTPFEVDMLKGAQAVNGEGQFKLQFWCDSSDRSAVRFDWKLQLSVPGGGLLPTSEEFAFQAPADDYQAVILMDMQATNQDWQSQIRAKYFVHLNNGDYGRIDLFFLPESGIVRIHSVVNPFGSQNLESAQ